MTRMELVRDWNPRGGATVTINRMWKNIREAQKDPRVWEVARDIIAQIAPRDQHAQAREIRRWCRSHYRYVADPVGVELLQTPIYLMNTIKKNGFVQGDCDEAASLTATLLSAVGIPAMLEAVAFDRKEAGFSHVYTVAHPRPGPSLNMDVSRPEDAPQRVISRRQTLRI